MTTQSALMPNPVSGGYLASESGLVADESEVLWLLRLPGGFEPKDLIGLNFSLPEDHPSGAAQCWIGDEDDPQLLFELDASSSATPDLNHLLNIFQQPALTLGKPFERSLYLRSPLDLGTDHNTISRDLVAKRGAVPVVNDLSVHALPAGASSKSASPSSKKSKSSSKRTHHKSSKSSSKDKHSSKHKKSRRD